jgi:hypothetical protein
MTVQKLVLPENLPIWSTILDNMRLKPFASAKNLVSLDFSRAAPEICRKSTQGRLERGCRMMAEPRPASETIETIVAADSSAAGLAFEDKPPLAQYNLVFGRDMQADVQVPPEIVVQMVPRAGGRLAARLSGGKPDADPRGLTEGYSIRLPEAFEQAASGRMVRIAVCVRSASGMNPAEFYAAYSTNEVGNSGWRRFEAGRRWQTFTFDYDVNLMVDGKGDFIGILPGGNSGPAIDISYITAEVFDRT